MQSDNDEKIWLEKQQSGILHKWVSDIKELVGQINARIWYPNRSHAHMLEAIRINYFVVFCLWPVMISDVLLNVYFLNTCSKICSKKFAFVAPFPIDADVDRLLMGSVLAAMLVFSIGLFIWYCRLRWQYQTSHLNTSVYRDEWLRDLTGKRREWEALGYSRGQIRSLTYRHYKGMAWAWGQDIFTQNPIYDTWCGICGFVKTRF
jgi:hypothetical protein